MGSSLKSTKLGLNLWRATDRPARQDFVNDNTILESVVGAHVNNSTLHVTASEKTRLEMPFATLCYTGTGSGSRVFALPKAPCWGVVFCLDCPQEDHADAWALQSDGKWSRGGVTVSNTVVTVHNGEEGIPSMNEEGLRYLGIFFPKLS